MAKRVVFLLADGFEEIEAITAVDVLRRANLNVIVAGVGKRLIRGAHNLVVKTDMTIGNYRNVPHAVVVPGGSVGVRNLARSKKAALFLRNAYERNSIIAAICAAPAYVIAPLGLLRERKATCYPGCEGELKKYGARFVKKDIVLDGAFITSRGPGTAFDFALAIVEVLAGKAARRKVGARTLYEK